MVLGAFLCLVIAVAQATTLAQAVRKVQEETGGKVLSATTLVEGGQEVHVIRVLTPDGRVRTVRVPGRKLREPDAYPGD